MRRFLPKLLAVASIAPVTVIAASPAPAAPATRPPAVILCKVTDRLAEPHPVSYYEAMFNETGSRTWAWWSPARCRSRAAR